MMIGMVVLCVAVFTLLVVASGITPTHSNMSAFELRRRSANGDARAIEITKREALLVDVLSLQRVLTALFLVLFVVLVVVAAGQWWGIVIAVVVALEYGAVAKAGVLQRKSQRLYNKYEPALLSFIGKYPGVCRLLRNVSLETAPVSRLESREELQHLVQSSGPLLSNDEKKLILHGLTFGAREVHEVMTPRGVIDSISKKELLGPLVLDDLHKTGHSRFPVTDGDIDHVIGMLHVQDLLTLDAKRSMMAEKAMETRVFYIREDQTLQHALAAFLRTHHHLFIVVNEFRETVGILSLEDVIETLLGRKIVDEFDTHDDLRVVAERNILGNNKPEKREDV